MSFIKLEIWVERRESMIPLILWLNPYREEINYKGEKYRLSKEYFKKTSILSNMRICITIGMLLLAYFTNMYENISGHIFWEVILGIQLIFLVIFYIVLPKKIEEII